MKISEMNNCIEKMRECYRLQIDCSRYPRTIIGRGL